VATPPDTGIVPAPAPIPQTIAIEGFGFHPGEHVQVQVIDESHRLDESRARAQATADANGTIQVALQVLAPAPCAGFFLPLIVATGDEGTSVSSRLFLAQPMILCPQRLPPGGVVPTAGTVSPGAPAVEPALSAQTTGIVLSVSLRSPRVRRGGREAATISAASGETVTLTVRYRNHGSMHRSLQIGDAPAIVRWRVPRTAHTGKATVEVTGASSTVTIQTAFTVR
jgi:hypothetical protein